MTKTSHTPGPWRVGKADPHTVHATDSSSGGFLLASLQGVYPEKDANTRLIAAAPELLAALRECVELLDGIGGMPGIESMRAAARRGAAAIAKAVQS